MRVPLRCVWCVPMRGTYRVDDRGLLDGTTYDPAWFDAVEDERLRYYAATPAGLEAARSEAERMSVLLGIAQSKQLIV